jgi:hypothetical protein
VNSTESSQEPDADGATVLEAEVDAAIAACGGEAVELLLWRAAHTRKASTTARKPADMFFRLG